MRGYLTFLLAVIAVNLYVIESSPFHRGNKNYGESKPDNNEDYTDMKDFKMPDMKDFKMPDMKYFKMPDMKDFKMPDMKDFKMPDLKDFKMPDMKDFKMPDMKDFKMPEMENYTYNQEIPDIDYSALKKLKNISIFKKLENITENEIAERLKDPATFPNEWSKAFNKMTNLLSNKSSIYYQVLKEFNMTNAMNQVEKYVGKMGMTCSFCRSLAMYIAFEVKISKSPSHKIKNVINSVCSIYPNGYTKHACDTMVKDLKMITEYVNKGVSLNDICLNIKLCDNKTIEESQPTFSQDETVDDNSEEEEEDSYDKKNINEDRNEWKEIEDEQVKEKQAEKEDEEYDKETDKFLEEEEKEETKELEKYEKENSKDDSPIEESEEQPSENEMPVDAKTGKYYVNILKEKFKDIWEKGDPIQK